VTKSQSEEVKLLRERLARLISARHKERHERAAIPRDVKAITDDEKALILDVAIEAVLTERDDLKTIGNSDSTANAILYDVQKKLADPEWMLPILELLWENLEDEFFDVDKVADKVASVFKDLRNIPDSRIRTRLKALHHDGTLEYIRLVKAAKGGRN
jgi:hypothetical protein